MHRSRHPALHQAQVEGLEKEPCPPVQHTIQDQTNFLRYPRAKV